MSNIQVQASAEIDARPADVYAMLSDYKVGHPAILPKQFTELVVLKGGQGAGTVVDAKMKVLGQEMVYHLDVTEPEPGQVLREDDHEKNLFTTFTHEPINGGLQTRLTIATTFPASPGFKGFLEKLFTPGTMRGIFKKELANIQNYMHRKNTADSKVVA